MLVVSTEDVGHDLTLAQCYAETVKVMVLTRGMHGCDVYSDGHITHVRPRRALEIDPTGAGDTFTAAFLIRYAESRRSDRRRALCQRGGLLLGRGLELQRHANSRNRWKTTWPSTGWRM